MTATSRRRGVAYVLSWFRAEFVGMTVCRVIGHRQHTPDFLRFQRQLNHAFGHPASSDVWDIICGRCGGTMGRLEP